MERVLTKCKRLWELSSPTAGYTPKVRTVGRELEVTPSDGSQTAREAPCVLILYGTERLILLKNSVDDGHQGPGGVGRGRWNTGQLGSQGFASEFTSNVWQHSE